MHRFKLQKRSSRKSLSHFKLKVEWGRFGENGKAKCASPSVLSRYRPVLPGAASMRPAMSDSVLLFALIAPITSSGTLAPTSRGRIPHTAYINTQYQCDREQPLVWPFTFYLSRPLSYLLRFLFFPLSGSGTEGPKPSLRLRFDIEFDIDHRPTPRRLINWHYIHYRTPIPTNRNDRSFSW